MDLVLSLSTGTRRTMSGSPKFEGLAYFETFLPRGS